ncbi:MAG: DNA repair protein RecN [Clostridia bacterium]|nr:DNA repair protein RecN [Clostridia bacterium]
MLVSLSIKNVALIDQVEIEFSNGLNILSGETGAGKSVILDSINFVLGAKADKSMIRHGQDYSLVTCVFNEYPNSVSEILSEYDIEQSSELVIKRKFDINGNGYIKLNGENVTATMLRKVTAHLVDVHGQSEHFLLLSKAKQLECVDKGALNQKEIAKLSQVVSNLNELQNSLEKLGGNPEERFKRIDLLNYQINEINKAELRDGEKEELIVEKNKINNLEKLYSAFNGASSVIRTENGVTDLLITAEQYLKSIADLDNEYENLLDRIRSAREEIADIGSSLANFADNLEDGELNIEYIEHRLEIYHSFARKYGNSYQEIIEYYNQAVKERDDLLNFEENCSLMIDSIKKSREEAYILSKALSSKRKQYAKDFATKVTAKLCELGMPNAKFEVSFENLPELNDVKTFSSLGLDKIEFLFSANAGEPLKPLSKIISGGEMSRFMLALKTQLSVDSSTYIFDEIDAGISGITASIVAKQFAQISKSKQVIAISHLPQITAMSDTSLLIKKHEETNKTVTEVKLLNNKDKIAEIIRLIGGSEGDEIAVAHASNMITEAKNYKSTL